VSLPNGKRIGLELTEATDQRFRDDEAAKVQVPPNQVWHYEVNPITMKTNVFAKYEIDENGELKTIEKKKMISPGWSGNYPGIHVSEIVVQAIQRKAIKAKSWAGLFDQSQLAVLVNPAISHFERGSICMMVIEKLDQDSVIPFSAIYLIDPSKNSQFDDFIVFEGGCFIVRRRN